MTKQSKEDEQKDTLRAIESVEQLLKDVPFTKGDRKGRLTTTRLRKMYALALENNLFKAFQIKMLYLVQRNMDRREKELEDFVESLFKILQKEEDKMGFARLILEYTIMAYAAKEVIER